MPQIMRGMINWRTPRKSTKKDYDVRITVNKGEKGHSLKRVTIAFGKEAQERLKQYTKMRFSDVAHEETLLWFEFIEGKDNGYFTISKHKGQFKVQASITEEEAAAFNKTWNKSSYTLIHDEDNLFHIDAREADYAKK